MWSCERQDHSEYGAGADPAFRVNLTSMSLNNCACYRQTHAHSVLLGRKEWLENLVELVPRDTGAGIRNRDLRRAVVHSGGAAGEPALPLGSVRYGIHGVYDEVENDLLQLNAVAADVQRLR